MALTTKSKFYFGQLVVPDGVWLDFDEGGGEITATLTPGYYSPSQFCVEVERAMNSVGSNDYACTYNRVTNKITIGSDSVFSILKASGEHAENSLYDVLGMTGGDVTGAVTYTFSNVSGYIYEPQFFLLDYLSPEDNKNAIEGTVNKSASGLVEIIKYGTERFTEFSIDFINNYARGENEYIDQDFTAVEKARAFMEEVIQKANIEFMPDKNDVENFYTIQIEKTPTNQSGLGYRLREKSGQGFVGYYTTGLLTFRVVE